MLICMIIGTSKERGYHKLSNVMEGVLPGPLLSDILTQVVR